MTADPLMREVKHLLHYADSMLLELKNGRLKDKLQNYKRLLIEHENVLYKKSNKHTVAQIQEMTGLMQQELWKLEEESAKIPI